jgi:DNA-binding response OmpR family regulator
METTLSQSQPKKMPMSVSVELSAMGIIGGRWVPMRTESMDLDGVFLIAKEYIRPRELVRILIWLPGVKDPLYAILTASFVERTWDGFGIGAQISGISSNDQKQWNQQYRRAVAQTTPGYSDTVQPVHAARKPYVLVMEQALPIPVIDALIEQGLEIETVRTAAQAEKIASGGGIDLVIGSLSAPLYDGLGLCRSLAALPCPPRTLFITQRGTASDFESTLYAGATKVIARPCSHGMLLARICDLFRSEEYPELDEESTPDLDDLKPLPPYRQSASTTSARGYLAKQLYALKLAARTFFHSSTFEDLVTSNS